LIYRSLRDCVNDLERTGQLVRIGQPVDPYLEMAQIQRRVYGAKGPAIYFESVKGSSFPAICNLYGTTERTRFIFRYNLERLKKLFSLKADPATFFKSPFSSCSALRTALTALPKKDSTGPVLESHTTIDQLPQIQSWPDDGGAFVLLPQVYTEDCEQPDIMHSNLGMYRIQLSGNDYIPNKEIGMHYQIHRGIGIHHAHALAKNQPLKVSIFVGGPPAHAFSAVMYLPEHLPEVAFAGALGGRRFRYALRDGFVISTEADFCITGTVEPGQTKPEGPFGDHLGYYSLQHPFPFLKVHKVYHRRDAIWPFTVVGRPPQEDTTFGQLIQEIAGPMIPKEIPGIKAVHAVDAAGVHPLLLAIGSERYSPYEKRKPQELFTLANALLGYGPCSLAKYLFIVASEDNPQLNVHNITDFFQHLLRRVDWSKHLHFQTRTTIDTLDYSGTDINEGSKVVIAAAGEVRRELTAELPADFNLPHGYSRPAFVMPGILAISGLKFKSYELAQTEIKTLTDQLAHGADLDYIPLIILADDSQFTAETLNNFLWITFTRSNPSHDIYGVNSFTEFKHWGCGGPLIIDARHKTHHAPPLIDDPKTTRNVDALAALGGPLNGII
jgi:4-hydroxy-3-polyprenylbenzoate decarboxylase